MARKLEEIQIRLSDGSRSEVLQFWQGADPNPIDGLCQTLVREGLVDEIHYTKSFSITAETTKALEGRR